MGAGAGRSPRAAGMALELSLRTMDLQNRAPGRLRGWLRLVPGGAAAGPGLPARSEGFARSLAEGVCKLLLLFLQHFLRWWRRGGGTSPKAGPREQRGSLKRAGGSSRPRWERGWPRALGSCRQDGAERVLQPVLRGQSSFAFPGAAVPFPPAFRLRVKRRGALGAGELRGGLAAPRCPTCRLS